MHLPKKQLIIIISKITLEVRSIFNIFLSSFESTEIYTNINVIYQGIVNT